jgi:endonuclease/exonuclease/phosphatase family metal-dependent hydrolase
VRVRALTWNVKGFRGGVADAVEVVRAIEPDVVALQETGRRSRLEAFLAALDLRGFADPSSWPRRRVRNAIGVRRPWAIGFTAFHRFPGGRLWYPRGAAVADVGLGPARLRVICVHLGLHPAERALHARQLLEIVDGHDGPAIVAGDLNARPTQDAPRILAEHLHDVWPPALGEGSTYPAGSPSARIDYLFVTAGVEVVDARVIASSVSDHRPVVAELEIPGG